MVSQEAGPVIEKISSFSPIPGYELKSYERVDDLERARQLTGRFPELEASILNYTHATPEQSVKAQSGATVFGELYPEYNSASLSEADRAYVSVRALDWVRDGDYASFTACQPASTRLTPDSFLWLQRHTKEVLDVVAGVEVMRIMMVGAVSVAQTDLAINDLGKLGALQDRVKQFSNLPGSVDHDVLMLRGLSEDATLSPSFWALMPEQRELVLDGLRSGVNISQIMQLENVPASLTGLAEISEPARKLHMFHSLYDLAGAAGHKVQNGSVTVSEPTLQNYRNVIESLEGLGTDKTAQEAYDEYVSRKAFEFGLDARVPEDYAVTRLATMMRKSNPEEAQQIRAVFEGLHVNTQAILTAELTRSGIDDGIATLIYYAPALLLNLQQQAETSEQWDTYIATGLTTMARLFQAGRTRGFVQGSSENAVQTILSADIAKAAAEAPLKLNTEEIELLNDGFDVDALLRPVLSIDINAFRRLVSLADIPGKRIVIVGMGGGSDGVQGAVFAKLFERVGKTCAAVVSVRDLKPQSQSSEGTIAKIRTVQNHGGEVVPGVYKVTPETRGSGRFLEHLPASETNMYLVTDDKDSSLRDKLLSVIEAVGGDVDTIIGLDTGGDVLYATTGHDVADATPDQDIRTLRAIRTIGSVATKFAMIVAPGVDSPDNAEDVLQSNGASYFEPDTKQTQEILGIYKRWHMDGTDNRYFGKTPLAWQAMLKSSNPNEIMTLDLPRSVVTSRTNPWNPYVLAQPAMRGAFVMDLATCMLGS